jgi:hypothetical protein
MSEIAKALANATKITESQRLQQVRRQTATAMKKNRARMFVWIGLLTSVCVVALGALWVLAGHTPRSQPSATVSESFPAATPQPDAYVAPQPDPELESALANLVIKALIKTPNPRVLIGDRVFKVGDELIPGLILAGLDADDLLATDEQGITYRKNYSFPSAASTPSPEAFSNSTPSAVEQNRPYHVR